MDKSTLLDLIIENGLSLRQIPKTVTIAYSFDQKLFDREPGWEIIENVSKQNVTEEQYLKAKTKLFPDPNFRWENGTIYRKCMKKISQPEHAGWWMCQKVVDTSSTVLWNKTKHNLAPTLAESVSLFLKKS